MKIVEMAPPKPEAFAYHAQSRGQVRGSAGGVFEDLDDHTRLAAHMNQRSWCTDWCRMTLSLDEQAGRGLGSHIHLEGGVPGVQRSLEKVVTKHTPPTRKVWMTVGMPRLLIIGNYRMGFELVPVNDARVAGVSLTVFIDYALPKQGLSRLLERMFGGWYARWCTQRMADDAQAAFATPGGNPPRSKT